MVTSRIFCSSSSNQFRRHNLMRVQKHDRIPSSIGSIWLSHVKHQLSMRKNTTSTYHADLDDVLSKLKLDDERIRQRERSREPVVCSRFMRIVYDMICILLDLIFKNKPIDRFWFLENIARMPYFSYVGIVHMYETLGWWYVDSDIKRKHIEQEANETHHLAIMESLHGDRYWWNQFLTRHTAIVYFMVLTLLFLISPKQAYLSSELLERHAYDTYIEFAEQNKFVLSQMQPTYSSVQYMPKAFSMYNVFVQIANDERQHADEMKTLKSFKTIDHI